MKIKLNTLNELEKHIILNKGTEAPFTGEYNDFRQTVYISVVNVMHHCTDLMISFNRAAGGQVLMMKLLVQ